MIIFTITAVPKTDKLSAIAALRDWTDFTLREAKDAFEACERGARVTMPLEADAIEALGRAGFKVEAEVVT